MHPHCSAYSYEAFSKHGFAQALLMTCDRLLRCGADEDEYHKVLHEGKYRWYDSDVPVDRLGLQTLEYSTPTHARFNPTTTDEGLRTTSSRLSSNGLQGDTAVFLFGEWMMKRGHEERAIDEFLRLESYYPHSPLVKDARIMILECFYRQAEYGRLLECGERYLTMPSSEGYRGEISYHLGLGHFRNGAFSKAATAFSAAGSGQDVFVSPYRDEANQLEALSTAHLKRWVEARRMFLCISDQSKYSREAPYCAELCKIADQMHRKNPTVAGILAVVPGLGYLYGGYPKTATSALIINGALIFGTVEAFRHGNEGLGTTLGVFGLGWYAGNIYGSITSACRHNDKMESDLLLKFDVGFQF